MIRSVILFDTKRYGDNNRGIKLFGNRIVVETETAEQAEEIAAYISFADAGCTDEFYVEGSDR